MKKDWTRYKPRRRSYRAAWEPEFRVRKRPNWAVRRFLIRVWGVNSPILMEFPKIFDLQWDALKPRKRKWPK